eukprot:3653862-Amphidinium_carterae.1
MKLRKELSFTAEDHHRIFAEVPECTSQFNSSDMLLPELHLTSKSLHALRGKHENLKPRAELPD